MKIKDLLHWTKDEDAWIILSKTGFASLHPSIMIYIGEISLPWKAFYGHVAEILETFGKSNILYIADEETVSLVSSNKEWNTEDAYETFRGGYKSFNPVTNSKEKFPNERTISRKDFLGKTTHMKIGSTAFSRGFVEEGTWRPAHKGTDQFDGWVYDVRVPYEILRDYPEIKEVTVSEILGGPVCITVGPVQVRISREEINHVGSIE